MGALASSDDEAEEGMFLGMVIAATSFETATLSDERKDELQVRANAFFERFPLSKILRRVEFPDDADAEEMLRSMKSAIGLSEEQQRQREQLEAQLQSGELPMPFAWRPRIALGNVRDVAHLWELSKRSTTHEKKFHLTMVAGKWEQRNVETIRSRTPLFDLLTLFVLEDLELLSKVFDFFPKIAISQETLGELMNMSHVFSGSIFRQKCIDIQDRLKPHLAQILQPHGTSSEEEPHLPNSSRALLSLARTGDYMVYSDDAMLRMWILEEKIGVQKLLIDAGKFSQSLVVLQLIPTLSE